MVDYLRKCMVEFRNESNKIKLGKRPLGDRYCGGYWDMPGGKVESNDPNLTTCAIREPREETGDRIKKFKPERVDFLFMEEYVKGRVENPLMLHVFKVDEYESGPPESGEFEETDWFSLSEARKLKLTPETKVYLDMFALPEIGESSKN